jgi:addiction module RelE/StbE family toxin
MVAHMDLPGFRLHPLKGQMKGFWAVTVRANWRVIFRFDDGATDVDYVDYLHRAFGLEHHGRHRPWRDAQHAF